MASPIDRVIAFPIRWRDSVFVNDTVANIVQTNLCELVQCQFSEASFFLRPVNVLVHVRNGYKYIKSVFYPKEPSRESVTHGILNNKKEGSSLSTCSFSISRKFFCIVTCDMDVVVGRSS